MTLEKSYKSREKNPKMKIQLDNTLNFYVNHQFDFLLIMSIPFLL